MVPDVYFLALHEPYRAAQHPVPMNAVIVHAATLRHPDLPQPDGGRIYRCLTEFPGRRSGCVVPLSTLTYELDGGRSWPLIGDWERVVDRLVAVARAGRCDAMPLGLSEVAAALLANGPTTSVRFAAGPPVDPAERQQVLDELAALVAQAAGQGALWPGDDLVAAPSSPAVLPYRPHLLDVSWPGAGPAATR
ncbi:hypothetical protein [Nonomuraea sp. NPDC050310]|uniref:hypothetical protein n=1 Tax=Nonomuraea sp. NPDC050310 TaxID=3154935 RepID=UPI0033E50FF2